MEVRTRTPSTNEVASNSIIRILLMVPIYSLVAWLSIFFHKHSVYYSVIGDCYEAFTIAAFFALLCHYIAPDLHSQKNYFRGIKPKQWVWPVPWLQKCTGGENGIWRIPRSGLTWFNVRWHNRWLACDSERALTFVGIGDLDWRLPILSSARSHDHRGGFDAAFQPVLRGFFESGLLSHLGMLSMLSIPYLLRGLS